MLDGTVTAVRYKEIDLDPLRVRNMDGVIV